MALVLQQELLIVLFCIVLIPITGMRVGILVALFYRWRNLNTDNDIYKYLNSFCVISKISNTLLNFILKQLFIEGLLHFFGKYV